MSAKRIWRASSHNDIKPRNFPKPPQTNKVMQGDITFEQIFSEALSIPPHYDGVRDTMFHIDNVQFGQSLSSLLENDTSDLVEYDSEFQQHNKKDIASLLSVDVSDLTADSLSQSSPLPDLGFFDNLDWNLVSNDLATTNPKSFSLTSKSSLFVDVLKKCHTEKTLSRKNSDEKPKKCFKCPECPSEFVRLCDMKRHFTKHSKVKAFVCRICHNKFSRADSLKRHRTKMHYNTINIL